MLVHIVCNIMQRKMGITIVLTHTAQQQSITHQNCRNLKDQNSKYMNNSIQAHLNLSLQKLRMSSKLEFNFLKTLSNHLKVTG